jgi:hypothetical protein
VFFAVRGSPLPLLAEVGQGQRVLARLGGVPGNPNRGWTLST